MEEGSNGKLAMALSHIRANIGAFTPRELEEMVAQKLIDARAVPAELRTDYVRRRLRLRK